MPPDASSKRVAARETVDILYEIAILLVHMASESNGVVKITILQNTHLTRSQLSVCVSLVENGVNPEALAVC